LDFGAGSVLKILWGGGVSVLVQGVFGRIARWWCWGFGAGRV